MNKKKLAWQLPFLAILIIGTIIILKKQAPFRTDEGFVFGTVYKITYQSEDNLKEEIETELKKVDNSLSPFNPNSVITRVNHNEKTEVDSFFVHVFHLSCMGIRIQKIYRSGFTDSGQLTPNDRISKNRFTEQPDNEKRPSYNAGLQRYSQGIRSRCSSKAIGT